MRHLWALGLILLLPGCASERHFVRDSWPFGNPNSPPAGSETAQRALGHDVTVTTIQPQAGDVWPGPVQAMPTISDIEKNANQPLGQGYTPSLPSPYPPGQTPPDAVVPPLPSINSSPSVPVNFGGPLSGNPLLGGVGGQGGVVSPAPTAPSGMSPSQVPANLPSVSAPGAPIPTVPGGNGGLPGSVPSGVGGAASPSSAVP